MTSALTQRVGVLEGNLAATSQTLLATELERDSHQAEIAALSKSLANASAQLSAVMDEHKGCRFIAAETIGQDFLALKRAHGLALLQAQQALEDKNAEALSTGTYAAELALQLEAAQAKIALSTQEIEELKDTLDALNTQRARNDSASCCSPAAPVLPVLVRAASSVQARKMQQQRAQRVALGSKAPLSFPNGRQVCVSKDGCCVPCARAHTSLCARACMSVRVHARMRAHACTHAYIFHHMCTCTRARTQMGGSPVNITEVRPQTESIAHNAEEHVRERLCCDIVCMMM